MSNKIQVWFRPDQIECLQTVLLYMRDRFHERTSAEQPAIMCAATLAKQRVLDVRATIEDAVVRASNRK